MVFVCKIDSLWHSQTDSLFFFTSIVDKSKVQKHFCFDISPDFNSTRFEEEEKQLLYSIQLVVLFLMRFFNFSVLLIEKIGFYTFYQRITNLLVFKIVVNYLLTKYFVLINTLNAMSLKLYTRLLHLWRKCTWKHSWKISFQKQVTHF